MSEKSPTGQVQTWEENTRSERDKRGKEEEQIKESKGERVRGRQSVHSRFRESNSREYNSQRDSLLRSLGQQNAEEETKCVIWRIWMVC